MPEISLGDHINTHSFFRGMGINDDGVLRALVNLYGEHGESRTLIPLRDLILYSCVNNRNALRAIVRVKGASVMGTPNDDARFVQEALLDVRGYGYQPTKEAIKQYYVREQSEADHQLLLMWLGPCVPEWLFPALVKLAKRHMDNYRTQHDRASLTGGIKMLLGLADIRDSVVVDMLATFLTDKTRVLQVQGLLGRDARWVLPSQLS